MMTYDEAKVAECIRLGIGMSYGEIKRVLEWERNRLTHALSLLGQKNYAEITLYDGVVIFKLTPQGEYAYQKWAEIPF